MSAMNDQEAASDAAVVAATVCAGSKLWLQKLIFCENVN